MGVDARGHLPESKRGPPPDDGDVLAAGPGRVARDAVTEHPGVESVTADHPVMRRASARDGLPGTRPSSAPESAHIPLSTLAPIPVPHLIRPDAVRRSAPRSRVIRRTSMRGIKPTANISKGAPPPSAAALLAGRFESIIKAENLMGANDITARAATLYKNAVARIAHAHPLAVLSVQDLVVNAIHDMPIAQKVNDFILSVVGSVGSTLLIERRDSEWDEHAVETIAETQFLPYVSQAEQALYTSPLTVQDADIRGAVA